MTWAQIMSGGKLHLAYTGDREGPTGVSAPLCNTSAYAGRYRMTINVPLAHGCRRCIAIDRARRRPATGQVTR